MDGYGICMRELVENYFRAAKEKNAAALDDIFTGDAVYVGMTGATCNGLSQIKARFEQMAAGGEVRAWDMRRIIESGETGAAEWYFEYRTAGEESFSFDGVSVIEMSDGRIKRWSEFVQTVNKTYPFEV